MKYLATNVDVVKETVMSTLLMFHQVLTDLHLRVFLFYAFIHGILLGQSLICLNLDDIFGI